MHLVMVNDRELICRFVNQYADWYIYTRSLLCTEDSQPALYCGSDPLSKPTPPPPYLDSNPRKVAPKNIERVATDWHLVYPLSSWCARGCLCVIHSSASRAENQPHTPGLYCRDADGLEEFHMATHLLRLWTTDWRLLIDIQAGSHLLALVGLALIVCHSSTQNRQIMICLVNYICMLLISVSLDISIQWLLGDY